MEMDMSLSQPSDEVAIELVDPNTDEDWAAITDEIVESLLSEEVPDNVIKATELLICGWPTHKVAKRVGVATKTVKTWLTKYPPVMAAVAEGKRKLANWRLAKLEQQYLLAVQKSEEILDLPLNDSNVNSKLVATVAQHARFVISTFVGQKTDINVNFNTPIMAARNDALDYVAARLSGGEAVIDAEVMPVEDKPNTALLLPNGDPPFGEMGVLDKNEDGILCHACGRRFKALASHIGSVHRIKPFDYATLYMVDEKEL
jgi:hypothetical protein